MRNSDISKGLNIMTIQSHLERERALSSLSSSLILLSLLTFSTTLSGCGGSNLTAQEQERYEQLNQELAEVQRERNELSQNVQRAFKRSGELERSKKLTGSKTVSCQYRVGGQALGPLPFKKKKGKSLKLGRGKPSRSCNTHTLKVR